jgi:3-deoxy-manno-octulosonate cytidylyltransferase (CMP-KDO synthetase)
MEKTSLEISESLEQLRVIENGMKIKVKETDYQTIGVDTPEQLIEVERLIIHTEL